LIKANEILSNKRIGVALSDSRGNVLVENNIAGQNSTNGYGVQMSPHGSNNTFYLNDFANNYVHIDGDDLAPIANVWDNGYPSGGNFWDTYHGVDNYRGSYQNETGSDGIGDTSYQITLVNIDRFPLMEPFRSTPNIGEVTNPNNDNTLLIIIIFIIVASIIAVVFTLYWRRKKRRAPQNNLPHSPERAPSGRLAVPVFLTLSILIILNFASISMGSYGLGKVELFGGALYFDEILFGFISSFIGLFVTWRIIIKQKYANQRVKEMLFATVTSVLFVAYLLAYTSYRHFELFGLLQDLQPALVITWTFATALIGCCLGFLLGGVALKRMPTSTRSTSQPEGRQRLAFSRVGIGIILLFVGFVSGYVAGYIVWAILGQAQVGSDVLFFYAAELPPPLIYLLGWAVFGALIFSLTLLIRRVGSR
jgi:parallel beta-helix repeat protein